MKTKTIQAVRKVGNANVVFNDKLVGGRRSLKVWGWNESQYRQCKEILENQGCEVKLIRIKGTGWYNRGRDVIRLHVDEK